MNSIGRNVIYVGETTLLTDQIPVMLYDGDLSLNSNGGKLSMITLTTHLNSPEVDPKVQLETFIRLRKYTDAWELCRLHNDTEDWLKLGEAAIYDLDINFGIIIY